MIAQTPTFILEESLVVLNPARDRVHLLDPSARMIWDAFAADLNRDEIIAALVAGQDGNVDRVQQEIADLLQSWQQEGLTMDTASVSPADAVAAEESLPTHDAVRNVAGPVYTDDTFRLRDLIFRIRSGDIAIRQRVQALCRHLTAEPEHGAAETVFDFFQHKENWLLVQDGKQRAIADNLDEAVLALSEELTEIWHERRNWLLVAHAAALVQGNTCILLPGGSGSGKTTLAAALAHNSGCVLLGDELTPILRESGHAVSQPFCLRIKQGSVKPLQSLYPQIDALHPYSWGETNLRFLPPPNFRQKKADRTWPVTHIVFPRYERDAPMQLKPVSPVEAFRLLLDAECLLGSPILPETVKKLVRWIQERPAFTMKYGNLDEACKVHERLALAEPDSCPENS
ncbi:MAG: PqqD family peptide modification chaperone [Gammaproteobacteria bacterium]|nr:PqqD family peptide modification chaperone [Gammaproteobacteria bacterium]